MFKRDPSELTMTILAVFFLLSGWAFAAHLGLRLWVANDHIRLLRANSEKAGDPPSAEELFKEVLPGMAAHALKCEQCGDRMYRDKVTALCEEGDRLFQQEFAERWKELEATEK